MSESERVRQALTAEMEKRLLKWMARRMPGWVHSDHLTVLGVVAAIGIGAGYALSGQSVHWLWLASAMLVVNWFGDSLDGTLARVRHDQRPRYGYYLDHAVDAFTTVLIGLGIGLSPFAALHAGLGIVIVYLLMSINTYLESKVYDTFRMDYGVLGPTEVRILLIGLNTTAIVLISGGRTTPAAIEPGANLVIAGALTIMVLLLLVRFIANLRDLGREEPPPR